MLRTSALKLAPKRARGPPDPSTPRPVRPAPRGPAVATPAPISLDYFIYNRPSYFGAPSDRVQAHARPKKGLKRHRNPELARVTRERGHQVALFAGNLVMPELVFEQGDDVGA